MLIFKFKYPNCDDELSGAGKQTKQLRAVDNEQFVLIQFTELNKRKYFSFPILKLFNNFCCKILKRFYLKIIAVTFVLFFTSKITFFIHRQHTYVFHNCSQIETIPFIVKFKFSILHHPLKINFYYLLVFTTKITIRN